MKSLHTLLALATTASAALSYKGVDWSSLLVEEANGHSYNGLDGKKAPLETILAANGVNTVRQRLWANPSGDYSLDYNLRLARRAHAAKLGIYLDLHFSDDWADPSNQDVPSGWPSTSDIDALSWKLYNHTLETANAFADEGIPIALFSLGNEITGGILFPAGEISQTGGAYNAARLLHSAAAGVKDSSMSPKPKLMLHLDNGWKLETQEWWYDLLLEQGPLEEGDFDVQGVSYYPFYSEDASLSALGKTLTGMKSKYGKEVMVVETNWPTSCPSPKFAFPADTKSIPFSAAGQSTWLKKVAAAGGSGLFYWEPAWTDNQALGSSCESNTMFEYGGKALSSLATFKEL